MNKIYTVAELAKILEAEYIGNGNDEVSGIAALDQANKNQVSFLSNPKFKLQLNTTQAGCVLLSAEAKDLAPNNAIVLDDPYLGFARVAQLLDTTPIAEAVIDRNAVIDESARIGSNVAIAAGVVIEKDCTIGDNVSIGANCVIAQDTTIGDNTRLFANVTIYHGVTIGKSCLFHAGAVIGADGFGFANDKGEWVKIPQMGRVIIGNQVEVGANACIDRGALKDTLIGDGVKLDNLCHIAHNVELGKNVAMAAYAGVAGSTKVGDYSTFSGRATILGHLSIAAGTHVTACSVINRSNKEPGVFSSGTGMQDNKTWRKNVARFRNLDELAKQVKSLERQLVELKQQLAD
jgi:UDP-3-O-[3-hydroxymyristoyl] glucosamine N-acyltransferase